MPPGVEGVNALPQAIARTATKEFGHTVATTTQQHDTQKSGPPDGEVPIRGFDGSGDVTKLKRELDELLK